MPYDMLEPEEASWPVIKAVCAAIGAILLIALCWSVLTDASTEEQPAPTYTLNLDCSNAAQMHRYGMPTKADCMEFHLHGQWGFYRDGTLYAFDRLPGGSDAWDDLYGIENSNAFHY